MEKFVSYIFAIVVFAFVANGMKSLLSSDKPSAPISNYESPTSRMLYSLPFFDKSSLDNLLPDDIDSLPRVEAVAPSTELVDQVDKFSSVSERFANLMPTISASEYLHQNVEFNNLMKSKLDSLINVYTSDDEEDVPESDENSEEELSTDE